MTPWHFTISTHRIMVYQLFPASNAMGCRCIGCATCVQKRDPASGVASILPPAMTGQSAFGRPYSLWCHMGNISPIHPLSCLFKFTMAETSGRDDMYMGNRPGQLNMANIRHRAREIVQQIEELLFALRSAPHVLQWYVY